VILQLVYNNQGNGSQIIPNVDARQQSDQSDG